MNCVRRRLAVAITCGLLLAGGYASAAPETDASRGVVKVKPKPKPPKPVRGVPEIDAKAGSLALAFVTGVLLLASDRARRRT
jgi:hypothetical protein